MDGSCVLTLQNARGRAHRVHLCRNDGQPQGLVYTRRFDLVVMNGGAGRPADRRGLGAGGGRGGACAGGQRSAPQHAPVSGERTAAAAERVARYSAGRAVALKASGTDAPGAGQPRGRG